MDGGVIVIILIVALTVWFLIQAAIKSYFDHKRDFVDELVSKQKDKTNGEE